MLSYTVFLGFIAACNAGPFYGVDCDALICSREGDNTWAGVEQCMSCAVETCTNDIEGLSENCAAEIEAVQGSIVEFVGCMGDSVDDCVSFDLPPGFGCRSEDAPFRNKRSPRRGGGGGGGGLQGCFMHNSFKCLNECPSAVSPPEHPLLACVRENVQLKDEMMAANEALRLCAEANGIVLKGPRSSEDEDSEDDDSEDED